MADAPGTWAQDPASRRAGKSAAAFRTISEVSEELDVPQHVLRFWETKFPQVKPLKRAGGRRYYRPEDVVLLRVIRDLLYRDGFTIKGAQKHLREGGARARLAAGTAAESVEAPPAAAAQPQALRAEPPPAEAHPAAAGQGGRPVDRTELKAVLDELEALRELLRKRPG
jgi:DNA-binding transcriptional MerR regulator